MSLSKNFIVLPCYFIYTIFTINAAEFNLGDQFSRKATSSKSRSHAVIKPVIDADAEAQRKESLDRCMRAIRFDLAGN